MDNLASEDMKKIIDLGKASPLWDSFDDPPSKKNKGSAASSEKLQVLLKILRLLAYILVFLIVLVTATTSILLFITMSAQFQRSTVSIKLCGYHACKFYSLSYFEEERVAWMWGLIVAFSVPEILTFLRSVKFYLFKDSKTLPLKDVFLIFFPELIHSLGMAVVTFAIFPHIHPLSALALCNCVSIIPAFLDIPTKLRFTASFAAKYMLSALAFVSQLTSCFVWFHFSDYAVVQLCGLPLILISIRWWENYAQLQSYGRKIIKNELGKSKYKIYVYLAPAKIIIFALFGFFMSEISVLRCINMFPQIWKWHNMSLTEMQSNFSSAKVSSDEPHHYVLQSNTNSVLTILCLQVTSSYVFYAFAKFAYKIKVQKISLVLPVSCATPIAFVIAVTIMKLKYENFFILHNYIGNHLFFFKTHDNFEVPTNQIGLWVLWWISHLWIHRHISNPSPTRNAPTDRLFVCPWYNGLLVAQCVSMNYRILQNYGEYATTEVKNEKQDIKSVLYDEIPRVFVCATMWHETQEEMMGFLKSIIRLDEHQCGRRMEKMYTINQETNCDYYELETNIFFDDAFVAEKDFENSKNPPLNNYVKDLITSMESAASQVYGVNVKLRPPSKSKTPYGGRLVWTLPGRSKLIAHLKNKDKIRHKKRWSQVMYMYYLLGFRIMELENCSLKRKAKIAKNTYLLALDGDIDFQPQAVELLIGRMKVMDELGAACGRIHPVGKGPMVWYQTFEYAIGHWLQKATEHIIGCVLCSPGCFSLFRGSALMENSVIKKYTKVSKKSLHFVQYDQGEDRWLCTLLLKQGLRVEYSAASDAYTHAPETFNEFYNQRRRWIPSTIANIFDLLSNADLVVKNNSYISTFYIWYQIMLMIGTVLGPGTIFLMMVGAFVTVFGINIWAAFLWNFFPVLTFITFCIFLKQKFQLYIAFVISTIYCLVMMAVLIGIIIQIIEDGPLTPSSVFFLTVSCQIVIAGLVHPQEISDLFCGVVYYITIPSMYMLLLIYSVFNMNDVSWGTREVVQKTEGVTETDREKIHSLFKPPGWINDPLLSESPLCEISLKEKRFWKDLIYSYLEPLCQSQKEKQEIVSSLKGLRNFCAFAFFMVNSLFVLVVFLLQLHKDYLHLDWPIGPLDHITFDDFNSQIYIYRRYKELDPIGLCFVVFFGFILIIQFIAMFVHRCETISHILATTNLC